MSAPKHRQLAVLTVAEKALKIGSGLCAVGLAALLIWRAGLDQAPTTAATTTIYMPVPIVQVESSGSVSETESEGSGYILVVETTPDGAEVIVSGESKGTSPSSLNLDCAPGAPLVLELRHKGFAPLKRVLQCKKDAMVVLRASLEAAK